MSLSDVFMLPPRIRTMQPMDDLLVAEESEIELLHQTIQHEEAQLFVCTAVEELSRYERVFALPANPALSIPDRRKRIIAKMNARAPSTMEFMKTTIENLTGLKVAIKELHSMYTLRFTVYLNDVYQLDVAMIKAQIKELRPAHLLFEVLPVAQISIDIPFVSGIAVGVYKEYHIPIKWAVEREQMVTVPQLCRMPAQSHKIYEIEVKP